MTQPTSPILLAALLIVTTACGGNVKNTQDEPGVYKISLEAALDDERQFKLSDIARSLEYVELKTPDSIAIMATNIAVSKKYIFVVSELEVYQFTMAGDFVRKVGRQGRGPGEYLMAIDMVVDEAQRQVYIMDDGEMEKYSFDGGHLGSVKTPVYEESMPVGDSLLYAASPPYGYNPHKLVVMNDRREIIGGITNRNLYDTDGWTMGFYIPFREAFYKHRDRIYFKGFADNDTIWRMDGRRSITHAVIDMGRFKSPEPTNNDEFQKFRLNNTEEQKGNFYQVTKAQEDDDHIWLTVERYYDRKMGSRRVMFDKAARRSFSAVTAADEMGIEDDILRGPAFWPEIITEDKYISVVEAYRLIEATEDAADLAPELKTFLSSIDDSANTIVVIAKR